MMFNASHSLFNHFLKVICFLLLQSPLLIAQEEIIEIPDTNFLKALIENHVDQNNDQLIQINEALSIDSLNLFDKGIRRLEGLNAFTNLRILSCSDNKLEELNISRLVNLELLNCSYNEIEELNVSHLVNLEELDCSWNKIQDLDLSLNNKLKYLGCSELSISSLDLSSNRALKLVHCSLNDNLSYINIKNGSLLDYFGYTNIQGEGICESYALLIDYNPNLKYICADSNEVEGISNLCLNYVDGYDLPRTSNYIVSSQCSFKPSDLSIKLETTVKVAESLNDCAQANSLLTEVKFRIVDEMDTSYFISNRGNANLLLEDGDYLITPIVPNSEYYIITPNFYSISLPQDSTVGNLEFCMYPDGTNNDLEVSIIPQDQARPGFEAEYEIHFSNKGNTTLSGQITLQLPCDSVSLLSSFPEPIENNGCELIWEFDELKPFERGKIVFNVKLNRPTDEDNPLSGGEVLRYNVQIKHNESEITPEDNSFTLNQTVVNSFDPNDKTCLEGNVIKPSMIGQYVHYMIRFENTGTAEAINIVIEDVIDTSTFDIASLQIVSSSYDSMYASISDGNKAAFIFENINLPFNDENNDGYVVFKIKTLPTIQLNDTLSNTADIFFDFNHPIVTNTARSIIQEQTVVFVHQVVGNVTIEAFPNPATGIVNLETPSKIKAITLLNMSGQKLEELNAKHQIDVSNQPTGIYLLKIITDEGTAIAKIVKK